MKLKEVLFLNSIVEKKGAGGGGGGVKIRRTLSQELSKEATMSREARFEDVLSSSATTSVLHTKASCPQRETLKER